MKLHHKAHTVPRNRNPKMLMVCSQGAPGDVSDMDHEANASSTDKSTVTQKGVLDGVKVLKTGTLCSSGESEKLPGGGIFALSQ